MNECFEFTATRCQGLAFAGSVTSSVDSIVNTCRLLVEPSRLSDGAMENGEAILVYAISPSIRFEVFRGVVSKIQRVGDSIQIDAVTSSSYTKVDPAPKMTWENATAQKVLTDLLSMSRLGISNASMSNTLSDSFLHVWHTEGRSIADEVLSLLHSVAPNINVYGSPDGRTMLGTREEIASMFEPIVYPFDEAVGDTDTEVTRFSLRIAYPGVACIDEGGRFVGTLESVVHEIGPAGSYTDMILNEDSSSILSTWLNSPPGEPDIYTSDEEEE